MGRLASVKNLPIWLLLSVSIACGGGSPPPARPAPAREPAPSPPAAHEHGQPHHDHGQAHHEHGHPQHAGPAQGKPHGPLGHRFEKAEDYVAAFEGPDRDAWQEPQQVVKVLGVKAGMTVVDLGAGTGYFMPHLAKAVGKAGKLIALDVEADMVRHLKERAAREGHGNVDARLVPFDDPQLAPASVDRILIVNTWHHIPDRKVYGQKLASALTPKGSIWVVDFTMESDIGPPVAHRLPPETVAAELASAGLQTKIIAPAAEGLAKQYVVAAWPKR